jgi:hypothetical protein
VAARNKVMNEDNRVRGTGRVSVQTLPYPEQVETRQI